MAYARALPCLWEHVTFIAPSPSLSTRLGLPALCLSVVTLERRSLAGILQGVVVGLSICQRCHCKWMYLPICYHLLITDLGDNCHKSCHKMCHKTHFLGAEGDVWRGMKCLGSRDHKAWAVSLFHTPMNTHIVASVRLLQAT